MPAVLGAVVGFMYSVMNLFNAQLSGVYGNSFATVLFHISGLICVLPLTFKHLFKKHNAPIWMYMVGALGIFTVITSNVGVTVLGITATLSLTLLGQMACSMVFDQFGLWGFVKTKFKWEKALSLVLIGLGVAVMMLW